MDSTLTSGDALRWIPLLFRVAAVYGALALGASLTDLSSDLAQRMTQIAFVGVAGAFQWVLWVIASDPQRYQSVIPAAVFEKIAFGLPAIVFAESLQHASAIRFLASIDLILAAGFIGAWWWVRRDSGSAR